MKHQKAQALFTMGDSIDDLVKITMGITGNRYWRGVVRHRVFHLWRERDKLPEEDHFQRFSCHRECTKELDILISVLPLRRAPP
ncbi:MAG: hypothetical protein KKE00_05380 [Proteobacteria bacterium]|nr:hypothetical protein [Pseudomonadota bacterium]MBU1569939.1 hypothetical protein [Pseudomonadota bacterium]